MHPDHAHHQAAASVHKRSQSAFTHLLQPRGGVATLSAWCHRPTRLLLRPPRCSVHALLAVHRLGACLGSCGAHAVKHVAGCCADAAPNLEGTHGVGLSHGAERIDLQQAGRAPQHTQTAAAQEQRHTQQQPFRTAPCTSSPTANEPRRRHAAVLCLDSRDTLAGTLEGIAQTFTTAPFFPRPSPLEPTSRGASSVRQ